MVVSRKSEIPKVKIHLDGQEVEQVSKFVYLGELITENGKSEEEIHRRIERSNNLLCSTLKPQFSRYIA